MIFASYSALSELYQLLMIDEAFTCAINNITLCQMLVIDEVSMTSNSTFTCIDILCQTNRNDERLFGGIQVVLSRDFNQLRPVPDPLYNDNGDFYFHALVKDGVTAIHHFQLSQVLRQSDTDLITVIKEVSKGDVSTNHESLIING